MKKWLVRILLLIVLVFAVQQVFIRAVPTLIFQIAKWRKPGPMNTVIHAPKTDARLRKVVLPNPDFIYSACFYDLSENDLLISGVFPDTVQYCSLAFYDDRTQPYLVYNNFKSNSGPYTFRLTHVNRVSGAIASPSKQGTVLMRLLVTDSAQASNARAVQQQYKVVAVAQND